MAKLASAFRRAALGGAIVAGLGAGCAQLPELVGRGLQDLKLLLGVGKNQAPSPGQKAELLYEMLSVVLQQQPEADDYQAWLNTLEQGGSLEGIYNALTHSSQYRQLEQTHLGARPRSIQLFAREFIELQKDDPSPTPLDRSLAHALATPVDPSLPESPELSRQIRFGAISKSGARLTLEQVERLFVGASVFTLKRVLGDAALKALARVSRTQESAAAWYSDWVVRLAKEGVDFGLALRSKDDRTLHYKWALGATRDLMSWEVLNRLHRLVNSGEHPREATPSAALRAPPSETPPAR